jgi:hypothetical protein
VCRFAKLSFKIQLDPKSRGMESFDIARLEDACLKLYVSVDANERSKVTNELVSVPYY